MILQDLYILVLFGFCGISQESYIHIPARSHRIERRSFSCKNEQVLQDCVYWAGTCKEGYIDLLKYAIFEVEYGEIIIPLNLFSTVSIVIIKLFISFICDLPTKNQHSCTPDFGYSMVYKSVRKDTKVSNSQN